MNKLNWAKPVLIFSLLGTIIFFIGLGMRGNDPKTGTTLMYVGVGMAIISWIWSVINVLSADHLKPHQKKFWLIIVLVVPAFGGAIYSLMHQSRNKIVT